jgi:peroxiredoxin
MYALATPPVPRPAKEFTVVEPSGKQITLASLKGKVVMVQFLFTYCPHCQRVSGTLTKLAKDLGPLGFQPIGVAFDDKVTAQKVTEYIQQYNVGFPVGYSPRDPVVNFLGISVMERMAVPQLVIIDRQGSIRAQTDPMPTPQLQNEDYLRKFIGDLLKEKPAAKAAAK